MAAIDVRKAFLKGITYADLAKTTSEPARDVNFELSADVVAILRQCPGYETFNPQTEVLHMRVQDVKMHQGASASNFHEETMTYLAPNPRLTMNSSL